MTLKDFRIGWRTLVQEPAYSLVVILGLGVGLAASLLLFGFVHYSWQYNAQVPDASNVYVVKHRANLDPKAPWYDQAPLLLWGAASKAPGVVAATGYLPSRPNGAGFTVNVGGQLSQVESLTVLPGFAEMLGLHAVQGNLATALDKPDSFAISEKAALRVFGTVNAVGRTVKAEGQLVRVGAVLRTPPANTTIPFDVLLGVNSVLMEKGFREEMLTGAQGWPGKLLVRVRSTASVPGIEAALQAALDKAPLWHRLAPEVKQRLGKRKIMDIALSPLREAYFDQEVEGNFIAAAGDRAKRAVVTGLGAIAALILALAAMNYVNLAAVRMLRRQREVAMRKVLGASVRQILLHLLAESMLVAMVATAVGLLLAWLALPMFSELVNRDLDGLLTADNIGAALVMGMLLGVVTAAWPVWIAVRVRPGAALAGRAGTESARGMQFRRAMTVVQVATAMGFASVTLAVAWQTEFAMRTYPGFDPAPLLIVELPFETMNAPEKARSFAVELSAQRAVSGLAISEDAVGRNNGVFHRELKRPGGAAATTEMKWVGVTFFEQYRIKPEAGRLFDSRIDKEDDPVPLVINAIAARELGFANPADAIGQTLVLPGIVNKPVYKRVVGIAPEVRFHSLRETPRAMGYELATAGTILTVRAAGSVADAERAARGVWSKHFPDAIMKAHRASDILAINYADDARMAKLLAVATGIALAIAAFGTYVLSAHTVQRRSKEIVLRKLYGARRRDIGQLVLREIGALTLVAAAIGLPLAAVAIQRYLATFVEHAPVGYWTMLFALAATVAIALVAVARHAWIAIRMMPAEALRV
ncbi:FtsX-like permease family protein [Massilia cavernae]|uniref:FtsX-like permease family protein n=1 Tax=Massilia cavernae TaxID=2320864 RepID=A0A418X7D0_9BURK|nr:FtsX-like permease family protein [Massilia cavernae]RJG08382.1 FtsX-like permease family protein [Massilia cavernae]